MKTKQLTKTTIAAIAMLAGFAVTAQAQNTTLRSINDAKRGTERTMNYRPEGRGFVCVNGNNRYTRALYGGYTEYRIETSDRPIFAIYKKKFHRNVSFTATLGDKETPLEQTDYCKAVYADGMRSYELRSQQWGEKARIYIKVVALSETEGAVWQFRTEGFDRPLSFKAAVCQIANMKLKRSGDLGVDQRSSFDPAPDKAGLTTATWMAGEGDTYFVVDRADIKTMAQNEAAALFESTVKRNKELAGRIVFDTPNPYINTLGGALVMAADGDWDGKTWLHGCIGWRMPLAGWRAGYLGDVLGWNDRAISHFDAYAKSQVTNVPPTLPHPSQDPAMNLARAEKKWGTQMYSNGYICRNPERNDQMHHYDMNLNYIDELLWHFSYDADTAYMRKMWPVLKAHLAWEKRNYDPDGDGLYDAYCCIWASDALYYNGGAVTHSSAYNYRGNLVAARIAEIIGEDAAPYRAEAERILNAMNSRLWIDYAGHWAEFEDLMGLKRKHESAALWSIYTPIDCGAGSPEQFFRATQYVDLEIPHINVTADGNDYGSVVATSNWCPYMWSINNVAPAEIMHTALAFFEAGRADYGYNLLLANVMDQMYIGESPANFGQLSFYDAARGECYRDFGDCIGISSRALLQGLFGIVPDALNGRCMVRPGFPAQWDSASVTTPYLSYKFKRKDGKDVFEITQNFTRPLQIVLRQNLGNGEYRDIEGSLEKQQTIVAETVELTPEWYDTLGVAEYQILAEMERLGLGEPVLDKKFTKVDISDVFNSNVDDIFKNQYLSPRPPYTSLELPKQGVGEWCHPKFTVDINDSVFRTMIVNDEFTVAGVPFSTPAEGRNIVYTSLWDNYPDSVVLPMKGKANAAYLLMAGSTNHMQCRIDNALVIATYKDGTADTLHLQNPDNWCPIEQDYYCDDKAFYMAENRPYRVCLGNGTVSRDLGKALGITSASERLLPGGAAQMLKMPLNGKKRLQKLTVRTLSNDVVVGLMAVTLQ